MLELLLVLVLGYLLVGLCIAGFAWRDARRTQQDAMWRPRDWARAAVLGPLILLMLFLAWALPDGREKE